MSGGSGSAEGISLWLRRACLFLSLVTPGLGHTATGADPDCDRLIRYRDTVLPTARSHVVKEREKYRKQYAAFKDYLDQAAKEDFFGLKTDFATGLDAVKWLDGILTSAKLLATVVDSLVPASYYTNAKKLADPTKWNRFKIWFYKTFYKRSYQRDYKVLVEAQSDEDAKKAFFLWALGEASSVGGAIVGVHELVEDVENFSQRAKDRDASLALVTEMRKKAERENERIERLLAEGERNLRDIDARRQEINRLCGVTDSAVEATGTTSTFHPKSLAAELAVGAAANKTVKACGGVWKSELALVSHRCVANKKGDQFRCEVTLACKPALRSCKKMYCGTDKQIAAQIAGG